MDAFLKYRVVINATEVGGRSIEVFPPPPTQVATLLHISLQQHVNAAGDGPRGHVVKPVVVEDDEYGEGTRFQITRGILPATLKWLGQRVVNDLGSMTGHWVDISHRLESEAETKTNELAIRDADINPKYL